MPDAPLFESTEKVEPMKLIIYAMPFCAECYGDGYRPRFSGLADKYMMYICDCILRQVPTALADDPMLELDVRGAMEIPWPTVDEVPE